VGAEQNRVPPRAGWPEHVDPQPHAIAHRHLHVALDDQVGGRLGDSHRRPQAEGDSAQREREAGAASRAETRRRLVVAAGQLFAEQGYAATTVTGIARQAGVSLQTLYLACGSKRDLLRAVLGQALSGTAGGIDADYVPRLQAQMTAAANPADPEPERTLRAFAHVF
jgi:hypothetical protein